VVSRLFMTFHFAAMSRSVSLRPRTCHGIRCRIICVVRVSNASFEVFAHRLQVSLLQLDPPIERFTPMASSSRVGSSRESSYSVRQDGGKSDPCFVFESGGFWRSTSMTREQGRRDVRNDGEGDQSGLSARARKSNGSGNGDGGDESLRCHRR
jgi:hypothetical protein